MSYLHDRSIGYLTNLAARLFVRALSRELDEIGLSIGYMPVFVALGEGAAMAQKDLARHALVEQPTMAATLSRMERDGLIERLPNPADARSALVSLTPEALAKIDDLKGAIDRVSVIAEQALGATERARYIAALEKIIATLQAREGDAKD